MYPKQIIDALATVTYAGTKKNLVEVVVGISRSVVARREDEQRRIERAQAIRHSRQLGELVDSGMHIIGR